MESNKRNFSAAIAVMQYRDHVLSIASFPYSGKVAAAVNALRFSPAAMAVLHYVAGAGSTSR